MGWEPSTCAGPCGTTSISFMSKTKPSWCPHRMWGCGHACTVSKTLRCHFAIFPVPTGPGEEDCTPCAPESPAPHWRCVPACREGFYPADSHGLPNKVCKRYRTTRAKPGLMGSTASHDRIMLETAHSLMEIQIGMREPGQLWGWTPHAPALWISEQCSRTLPRQSQPRCLRAMVEGAQPQPQALWRRCGRNSNV